MNSILHVLDDLLHASGDLRLSAASVGVIVREREGKRAGEREGDRVAERWGKGGGVEEDD